MTLWSPEQLNIARTLVTRKKVTLEHAETSDAIHYLVLEHLGFAFHKHGLEMHMHDMRVTSQYDPQPRMLDITVRWASTTTAILFVGGSMDGQLAYMAESPSGTLEIPTFSRDSSKSLFEPTETFEQATQEYEGTGWDTKNRAWVYTPTETPEDAAK